ncbi:hypothetical protein Tco_0825739, partial [Tanacetum coccineum]
VFGVDHHFDSLFHYWFIKDGSCLRFHYHPAFCWYYSAAVQCHYFFFHRELKHSMCDLKDGLDLPDSWSTNDYVGLLLAGGFFILGGFWVLSFVVNAFVCTMDFIIVELTKLVLVPVSAEPDIDGGALNFTVSIAKISFRDDGTFFLDWFATTTSPLRKAIVTLIISSTDFEMFLVALPALASLLEFACLRRDVFSGPRRKNTPFSLSPSHVKTFFSLSPSLVITVVFMGLLLREKLGSLCLCLEKTLGLWEGYEPLDMVLRLGFLLFVALLFLSHDFDSESRVLSCVCEFCHELSPYVRRVCTPWSFSC